MFIAGARVKMGKRERPYGLSAKPGGPPAACAGVMKARTGETDKRQPLYFVQTNANSPSLNRHTLLSKATPQVNPSYPLP